MVDSATGATGSDEVDAAGLLEKVCGEGEDVKVEVGVFGVVLRLSWVVD